LIMAFSLSELTETAETKKKGFSLSELVSDKPAYPTPEFEPEPALSTRVDVPYPKSEKELRAEEREKWAIEAEINKILQESGFKSDEAIMAQEPKTWQAKLLRKTGLGKYALPFSREMMTTLLGIIVPPEPVGDGEDRAAAVRKILGDIQRYNQARRIKQTGLQNIAAGAGALMPYVYNPAGGMLAFQSELAKNPKMAWELIKKIPGDIETLTKAIEGDKEAVEIMRQHGFETTISALMPMAIALGLKTKGMPFLKRSLGVLKKEGIKLGQLTKAIKGKGEYFKGEPLAERVEKPFKKNIKATQETLPLIEAEASKSLVEIAPKYTAASKQIKVKPKPKELPDILGLNKKDIESIRKNTQLDKLPKAEVRKHEFVLNEAKRNRMDEQALPIADEILGPKDKTGIIGKRKKGTRRMITDEEHAGMVIKSNELMNAYDTEIKAMSDAIAKGDRATAAKARSRADGIAVDIDRLTEASDFAGREAARALSIRRMRLNRDTYDIVSLTRKTAAAKGRRLDDAEIVKLKKYADENTKLKKEIDKLTIENEKFLAEQEKIKASKIVEIKSKKTKITKKTKSYKEKILKERSSIKKELAKLGLRVYEGVFGLPAEASYQVGRLAVNYIKDGVVSLDGIVKKLKADIPSLTDRDIYRAMNEKNPKFQRRARKDVNKRIRQLKTQARLLEEIALVEEGIFKKPRKRQPTLPEIKKLQNKIRQLKTQARLKEEIALAEEGIFKKPRKRQPTLPEIKKLQNKLKRLRIEAWRSTIEASKLERAMETLGHLEDQLVNNYRDIKAKKTIPSAELALVKERISEVRRLMRAKDEIARLKEMIRTGDYEISKPVTPKKISPELERAQVELKYLRREINNYIKSKEPATIGTYVWKSMNTLRTAKATADMSYALRQGFWLSPRRPTLAGKTFGKAFKATFNEMTAEQIENAYRQHPNHYLRERAGLGLSELGKKLSNREEYFQDNFLEKIPVIKEIVGASERNMVTGLNLLRIGVFDEFLARYPNATHIELKAWADYINAASGKGKMNPATAKALSAIFFAPKFAWSRITTPFKIIQYWKLPRVRKEIAKDMAAVGAVGTMTLSLAALAGWEVSLDPRSSDFGKIKIGNTRIDIWAGFQQPMRFLIRLATKITDEAGLTGKKLSKSEKEYRMIDAFYRFAAYKSSPVVTLTGNLLDEKTIVGEPITRLGAVGEAFTPLVYDDIIKAYKDGGLDRSLGITAASFLGVGANTYRKKGKKRFR